MKYAIRTDATHKAIIDALREEMKTVNYNKITVRSICARCEVSTRTFYNHFKDKNDVLYEMLSGIAIRITRNFERSARWSEAMLALLLLIEEDISFYKNAATYEGQNSLIDSLVDVGQQYSERAIHREEQSYYISEDVRFINAMVNHEIYYQVVKWIRAGAPITAQKLFVLIKQFIPACLEKYYT